MDNKLKYGLLVAFAVAIVVVLVCIAMFTNLFGKKLVSSSFSFDETAESKDAKVNNDEHADDVKTTGENPPGDNNQSTGADMAPIEGDAPPLRYVAKVNAIAESGKLFRIDAEKFNFAASKLMYKKLSTVNLYVVRTKRINGIDEQEHTLIIWPNKGGQTYTPSTSVPQFHGKSISTNKSTWNTGDQIEFLPIEHLVNPTSKCYDNGMWFWPLDMPGTSRTVGTPEQCRQRCRSTPGCKYFNSFPNGACNISTGEAWTLRETNPTARSGHRDCRL